jgi:hypothetical protein
MELRPDLVKMIVVVSDSERTCATFSDMDAETHRFDHPQKAFSSGFRRRSRAYFVAGIHSLHLQRGVFEPHDDGASEEVGMAEMEFHLRF